MVLNNSLGALIIDSQPKSQLEQLIQSAEQEANCPNTFYNYDIKRYSSGIKFVLQDAGIEQKTINNFLQEFNTFINNVPNFSEKCDTKEIKSIQILKQLFTSLKILKSKLLAYFVQNRLPTITLDLTFTEIFEELLFFQESYFSAQITIITRFYLNLKHDLQKYNHEYEELNLANQKLHSYDMAETNAGYFLSLRQAQNLVYQIRNSDEKEKTRIREQINIEMTEHFAQSYSSEGYVVIDIETIESFFNENYRSKANMTASQLDSLSLFSHTMRNATVDDKCTELPFIYLPVHISKSAEDLLKKTILAARAVDETLITLRDDLDNKNTKYKKLQTFAQSSSLINLSSLDMLNCDDEDPLTDKEEAEKENAQSQVLALIPNFEALESYLFLALESMRDKNKSQKISKDCDNATSKLRRMFEAVSFKQILTQAQMDTLQDKLIQFLVDPNILIDLRSNFKEVINLIAVFANDLFGEQFLEEYFEAINTTEPSLTILIYNKYERNVKVELSKNFKEYTEQLQFLLD